MTWALLVERSASFTIMSTIFMLDVKPYKFFGVIQHDSCSNKE